MRTVVTGRVRDDRRPAHDQSTALNLRGQYWARVLLSVFVLIAPAFVLLLLRFTWRNRLPLELPSHWGVGGLSDTAVLSESLFVSCGVVALVGLLIAVVGYFVTGPAVLASRWVIALGGSMAATSSATWICAAQSALDQPDALGLPMGVGALYTMAGIGYGALPALLRPRRNDMSKSRINSTM